MSQRTDRLTDDAITEFLRGRSADAHPGLLSEIVRAAAATPQDRPWLGFRPSKIPRRTLVLASALLLMAAAAMATVGSGLLQPAPITSGGVWPLTDFAAAQNGADAGDPAYTWQLAPEILGGNVDGGEYGGEIVSRFIHDQLGWEGYRFNPFIGWEQTDTNLIYVRCAPGESNPMYPDDERFAGCAPTIDQLHYETVRIDLFQPIRTEPGGVWFVSQWRTMTPFAQSDPAVADAAATARLEDFLDARLAGQGAEGFVQLEDAVTVVPLMYTTSSGSTYERYLIERVGAQRWPYGNTDYTVRLFADGGATVVEQPVSLRRGSLYLHASETTENGQPLAVAYSFFNGRVTFAAADPWKVGWGLDNWGALTMGRFWSTDEGIELATCDPAVAPENAETLAHNIQFGLGEAATPPVAVSVGGAEAFMVDMSIDVQQSVCGGLSPSQEIVTRSALADGIRMRYYLVDLPDGTSPRILVIALAATEDRFQAVIEAAAPIIDSIAFRAP